MNELSIPVVKQTIREIMKDRKVTHKELAKKLGMSESGVKKIFTAEDIALSKLTKILNALEIEWKDFYKLTESTWVSPPRKAKKLTKEQSEFFWNHPVLEYFYCALHMNDFDVKKTRIELNLDPYSMKYYLDKLARNKIIDMDRSKVISLDVPMPMYSNAKFGDRYSNKWRENLHKEIERCRESNKNTESSMCFGTAKMRIDTYKEWVREQARLFNEFIKRSEREEKTCVAKELVDIGFTSSMAKVDSGKIMQVPRVKRKF